jgi:hypothetical protein
VHQLVNKKNFNNIKIDGTNVKITFCYLFALLFKVYYFVVFMGGWLVYEVRGLINLQTTFFCFTLHNCITMHGAKNTNSNGA